MGSEKLGTRFGLGRSYGRRVTKEPLSRVETRRAGSVCALGLSVRSLGWVRLVRLGSVVLVVG